jgi:hypothetical protein
MVRKKKQDKRLGKGVKKGENCAATGNRIHAPAYDSAHPQVQTTHLCVLSTELAPQPFVYFVLTSSGGILLPVPLRGAADPGNVHITYPSQIMLVTKGMKHHWFKEKGRARTSAAARLRC